MKQDEYIWINNNGEEFDIRKMPTQYIINCIKLMNKMEDDSLQLDTMYRILNIRVVDTDSEIDSWY